MPKRFDTYRFKDGLTPLSADTFNPIFLDVDNRIAAIELLKISWLDAVALVTAQGLKRIDAVLLPSLDAINASSAQAAQTVVDAQAALNALPNVAMQADLTTAVANMNAAIAAIPVPDTSVLENNIALNAFRIAINGALSLQTMVDGFVDEYVDETGIEPFNGDPIPTSLMHFDGIAGSSAIVEIGGHAWVSTNAVIDTSLSVFGGSSLAIAQGSNSYLSLPSHVDYIFNNNIDFTIEMRIYPKTPTAGTGSAGYGNGYLLTNTTSSLNQQMSFAVYPGGGGSFLIVDTITSVVAIVSFPANSIPFNAWSHLALVRSAGTISIYVNGTAISLTSSTGSNALPATGFTLNIGKTGGNVANGGIYANIDEFRVLKGIAAYTANFTPSVNPFPDGTTPGTASNNQVYDAVTDSYSPSVLAGQNIVPVMTSNTAPSGIASSSSNAGAAYLAWGSFNGADTANHWATSFTGSDWLAYEFTSPRVISEYKLWASTASDAPKSWRFEGWNGTSWVVLDTQTGIVFAPPTPQTFACVNNVSYIKYRLFITQDGGYAYVHVVQMEMNETPRANITLQSTTQPALTQPTTGNVILLEEDVDAVTLNTDLVAAVSRDGGTTWSNAPLVDKGTFTAGKRILTASADLSTQPAGQSMAYKVTTANGKNLKLHGASLGWK